METKKHSMKNKRTERKNNKRQQNKNIFLCLHRVDTIEVYFLKATQMNFVNNNIFCVEGRRLAETLTRCELSRGGFFHWGLSVIMRTLLFVMRVTFFLDFL